MLIRIALALLAAACGFILFFYGLDKVGLLGPDEPRYASIGREMAASGDWITPRLWGEPWFEKPALLYWMTAIGFSAGLSTELAPRIPVALLGVAFLAAYGVLLARLAGRTASLYATLMLATSAAWLAFSHVAVTDLPLTAFFTIGMLLVATWVDPLPDDPTSVTVPCRDHRGAVQPGATKSGQWLLWCAGALLGLASLAKGLVPMALCLPVVWFARHCWRSLWPLPAAALLVALPWYVLCTAANGKAFLEEFFWKHHVQRFFSDTAIHHVQPFWYYVPVLTGGLFPWFAMAALLRKPQARFETYLWGWFGFGFILLSLSRNKLPGYLLPLLPALTALLGIALARTARARWPLATAALVLGFIPLAGDILPNALEHGLLSSVNRWPDPLLMIAAAGLAGFVWAMETYGHRALAVLAIVVVLSLAVLDLKRRVFPILDQTVSARGRWKMVAPASEQACLDNPGRDLRYGMNYYSVRPLPDCEEIQRPVRIP